MAFCAVSTVTVT